MKITHASSVTPDQIDHLGHMNVRFYGVNARAGTKAILAELGLEPDATRLVDLYTRHFAEQLEGAKLELRSQFLPSTDQRLNLYHELYNTETEAIAATFVHGIVPTGATLPASVVDAADAEAAAIPAHGAPRTIDLAIDRVETALTLKRAQQLDLATRRPRMIGPDECDTDGGYSIGAISGIGWVGERLDGHEPDPGLLDGPNGEKIGFAAMETRSVVARLPRLDERVQAFGANLAVGDKMMHRVQWVFALDTSELLVSSEVANLAFDTISRRAVAIPDAVRAFEENMLLASRIAEHG